jgi:hypothetical protein
VGGAPHQGEAFGERRNETLAARTSGRTVKVLATT